LGFEIAVDITMSSGVPDTEYRSEESYSAARPGAAGAGRSLVPELTPRVKTDMAEVKADMADVKALLEQLIAQR
jgi:hypothetical protein